VKQTRLRGFVIGRGEFTDHAVGRFRTENTAPVIWSLSAEANCWPRMHMSVFSHIALRASCSTPRRLVAKPHLPPLALVGSSHIGFTPSRKRW
jgi:hypothetical protein